MKRYTPNRQGAKALPFILGGILLFLVFAGIALHAHNDRTGRETFRTEYLRTIEEAGTLDIVFTHEKEPIDIILLSPDGNRYAEEDVERIGYYDQTDTKTTISLYTDALGDWYVEYTSKSNDDIKVEGTWTPGAGMQITNTSVRQTENRLWFYYTPVFHGATDPSEPTDLRAYITLENGQKTVTLYNGSIVLNQEQELEYDTTGLTPGTYDILVTIYTDNTDENDPYATRYREHIALPENTDESE